LKLNKTHQLLVYADDANDLMQLAHYKGYKDVFLVSSKEIGLIENAGRAMYKTIFQQQNERQYQTLRNVINHSTSWHS